MTNVDKLWITKLEEFVFKKRFNTRGLPLAKKMWRDGYNKALEDFLNYIKSSRSKTKVVGNTKM